MKKLRNALPALVLVPLFAGCSVLGLGGNEHVRWTEEVKLSDGSVINIQRHVELTASGFPAQRRGFNKYYEICYPPMGLHWKSSGGYRPDIFDIVDGKAYIHVPVAAQHQCNQQRYPEPNALYFVWENDRWKQIRHEEFPASSEWNLLMQTSRGSSRTDPKGRISIQDKTNGNWRDPTLRDEQKLIGWRRVNEARGYREGCSPWGKTSPELGSDAVSIFVDDGKNTCQP